MTKTIRCKCANCGKRWPESKLVAPADLYERLTPGCTVPAGECPDCGALCYQPDQICIVRHRALRPYYSAARLVEVHGAKVAVQINDPDTDCFTTFRGEKAARVFAAKFGTVVPGVFRSAYKVCDVVVPVEA